MSIQKKPVQQGRRNEPQIVKKIHPVPAAPADAPAPPKSAPQQEARAPTPAPTPEAPPSPPAPSPPPPPAPAAKEAPLVATALRDEVMCEYEPRIMGGGFKVQKLRSGKKRIVPIP